MKKGQRVCVLWGKDKRPEFKDYVGKDYYAVVLKRGKVGWWVEWDEGGTMDTPTSWITWL